MRCHLTSQTLPTLAGLRAPTLHDREALASLLLESYRDTLDEEFETYYQTLIELDRLANGEYDDYLMRHSRVMEYEGRIVSAALITYWHQCPLLAYAMTLPHYQQQGFGRNCIQHAMQSLFEAHYPVLSLVVTVGNTPAMQLYKQLGFMETPE